MEDSFNSIIYKELNPDLIHLKNKTQTEEHWEKIGKKENRLHSLYQLYPSFDWEKYRDLNPYLSFLGLKNRIDYEIHFMKEGRYTGKYYEPYRPYSFHILLATLGKPTIFRMLTKLKYQLNDIDYLTIIFDGEKKSSNIQEVKNFTKNFPCKVNIIVEKENLGYWGHSIRNKYHDLEGDFVYHIDDDDILLDNAMDTIRRICRDINTIYIFRIILENDDVIWKSKKIVLNEISTQSGVIPIHMNKESFWELKYGGDHDFYKKLYQKFKNQFLFLPNIIYKKY